MATDVSEPPSWVLPVFAIATALLFICRWVVEKVFHFPNDGRVCRWLNTGIALGLVAVGVVVIWPALFSSDVPR